MVPSARFEHVHLDIVGLVPVSQEFKYILTCIDRFSHWPEATLLLEIDSKTVASTEKTDYQEKAEENNFKTRSGRKYDFLIVCKQIFVKI